MIENEFKCDKCSYCYYSPSTLKHYNCYVSGTVKETHGFGWVLLMSGLLYREINAALAFEKLHWDVFKSSLRASLGFKYSKAQAFYFQKGSDHHKLWNVLEIMYLSLVMELMVFYVRGCVSRDVSPTVNDY